MAKADKKNKEENSEKSFAHAHFSWYPGHMAKTKREIIEDLKLIDVVIEILDARIPVSSQNPDIKNIIAKKKKIILLNKCDLADEAETKKWKENFEKNGQAVVLVNSNDGKGINQVIAKIEEVMKDEIEANEKKGRVGKIIRVLILGIPNVGKSSFINRVSKKTTAKVGNRPGVTTQKQWIRVAKNIELLDTPGVLWPKFESDEVGLNLAFTGSIKDDILDKEEIAFYLLKYLIENYLDLLGAKYDLDKGEIQRKKDTYEDRNQVILETMEQIGKRRGALVSGGRVDNKKVANILLQDFREAKIGRITLEKVEK